MQFAEKESFWLYQWFVYSWILICSSYQSFNWVLRVFIARKNTPTSTTIFIESWCTFIHTKQSLRKEITAKKDIIKKVCGSKKWRKNFWESSVVFMKLFQCIFLAMITVSHRFRGIVLLAIWLLLSIFQLTWSITFFCKRCNFLCGPYSLNGYVFLIWKKHFTFEPSSQNDLRRFPFHLLLI